ncbi:MAG: hypothetical protein IJP13_03465 [Lachnospiraceae bacterium]|nr:hypothetical protein [Lachnospiraceae bacterium]
MKNLKRRMKRFMAMALVALMVGTTIDFSTYAVSAVNEESIEYYEHHTEYTAECTCETDDPAIHATNCPAYIAPENPQCTCAEKCTDDTLNVWCDVCGMQGVSVCQGEDIAVIYEEQTTGDFTVTGGTYGQDYTYDSETRLLTIQSSTEITIENTNQNTPTEDMIFVADGVNANIILAGVNINVGTTPNDYYDCPLRIADDSTGDVNITIQDETINTLTSYIYCAGIQKTGDANTGTLTIRGGSEGSGVLNAASGSRGAGIGGGHEGNGICANIKIENAIVNATGGSNGGAGIGAGSSSEVSALATNIQIINSTVTATGDYASGIGGGALGEASNITICGGSVKAVVNRGRAYGIGSGHERGVVIPTNGTENVYLLKIENPEGKTVYIDGNAYSHNRHNEETTVYAYVTGESHTVKLVGAGENVNEVEGTAYHFYPTTEGTFVAEDTVMDTVSDFDITGGTAGVDYLYVTEEETLYLLTDTALTISNKQDVETATTKIETGMDCNINVTFAGVNIDVSDTTGACAFKIPDNSTGTVTITLADNSTNTLKSGRFRAGIQKNGDAGTLMIQGENSGNGVLNATSRSYGAGIGGGNENSSNNITIKNAIVTVTSGGGGAGIGGGCNGNASNITINNATVTANGDGGGAGIGGGATGSGSNIAITGGSVKAEGGNEIGGGNGCAAVTPTDSLEAGAKNVYLLVIENPYGEEIKIDGDAYNCKAHQEETYVYAYLTGNEHTVEVGGDETEYFFIDGTFVKKSELVLTDAMDFSIEGGSYGTDYLYDSNNNVLYILNDTKLTIQNKEGVAVADTTIVTGVDCNANIVLAGVNIDVSDTDGACAFKIPDNSTGTVTITLKDGTTNTLSSGDDCAGVQKNGDEGTLIIQGENSRTGVLNVTGGDYGAGIGSASPYNVCNITISNAVVNATGGDYGAGIGLSGSGGARNITIRNAVVTATGSDTGAGIGGSSSSSYVENIAIYNSSVKTVKGEDTPAIGYGTSFAGQTPNPVTPTASLEDGAANVYLFEMNETSGKTITINGVTYPDNHMGESKLYVYLPAVPANEVTIDGVTTKYCYDTTNQKWVTAIDIPEEPGETTFTYDGEEKTYVLLENDTYYTITGNVQANAGNYTVTVSLKDKENTVWSDGTTEDKEYSFVINKADSVLETVPTPKTGLTYTGGGHNLISAGTATGGEMQYSLDGTNYSSAIPTGTDAKTYTVWYKVDGDENHNDTTPASIKVTIAPKTLEISSVTAINRAFDGTNTVEISEVIIEGILDEDEDKVSVSATAAIDSINAGEYIIVDLSNITLTGSANYSIAASVENVPLTTAVTISKADAPTLPSGSKAYVYSIGYEGESVSITGLPTNCGEVEYSLLSVSSDMFENLSVDSRSGKITYDVKALDNYTEDLQGTISVNVMMENYKTAIYTLTITRTEKIPQEISAENLSLTYGDADVTISVTGAKTELSYEVVQDSNANGDVVTVDESGKICIVNAGTATVKITATDSEIYEKAEYEIIVTIEKRPVSIEAESYTVKKGDELPAFEYDVIGLVNGETLPITVNVTCTASDTNTVGTYDITVLGTASEGNYTYTYKKGMLEVLAEDEAPFIVGDDGKMGWDAISDEIEDANKGDTIVVDMNGATVVPGDIIEEARDKGITISFVLDNGLTWTIDGSTVTDGDISNINFDTTVEDENNPLNNIPVDVIKGVTGEKATIEVNLTYSGNFGFTAVLKANLGSDNAGYYANLYYYNPTTGELEYICADVIASNGETEFTFTHASDYLVVIDDEDLGKKASDDDKDTTEDKDDGKNDINGEVPDSGDIETFYLWAMMFCAILVMVGLNGYNRVARKK